MDFKIAIEHLEDEYSIWLILEYINAGVLLGGMIAYTNIKYDRIGRILKRYGYVYEERVGDLFHDDRLIILDPRAGKDLHPDEVDDRILVIGGILGDHPPRGRTEKLLARRYPGALRRRLGKRQMSIDSAAYVAYIVSSGYSIEDIRYVDGLRIDTEDGEVVLPYRYPLRNREPIISPIILKIIRKIGIFDDYWLRTL